MLFDLIIINYNTPDITIECINSAKKTFLNDNFNIIVVDNNSTDNSVVIFREIFKDINIVETKRNLGYAAAINEGAKLAITNIFILSNSDIVFLENSVRNLIEPILSNKADITGPQLLYPNNLWQESYNQFPGYKLGLADILLINTIKRNYLRKYYKIDNKFKKNKKVDFVDGAILATNKKYFELIGGYDTEFPFYSEETSFCYQATKKGARIYHIPNSILIHYRGASYGINKIPINYIEKMIYSKKQFCEKYKSNFESKFYYLCEKYHFLILHLLSKIFSHQDTKYGNNYFEIYKIWGKVLNET